MGAKRTLHQIAKTRLGLLDFVAKPLKDIFYSKRNHLFFTFILNFMFTGIVKAVAPIVALLEKEGPLFQYAVEFPQGLLDGLQIGASVSVDGVCQTVTRLKGSWVFFEAISETLTRTTLGELALGNRVNLERAAKIGDEIGGHLLSGHIYGKGYLSKIEENIYTFNCPSAWVKYLFTKGFIAIDGASLTVVALNREVGSFTVHLIPETLKATTLGQKKEGDWVNLEFDSITQVTVETLENLNRDGKPLRLPV
jgi:riboflavin synthase